MSQSSPILSQRAKVTFGHDTDSVKSKKTDRLEKGLKSAIGKVKMKAAKGSQGIRSL